MSFKSELNLVKSKFPNVIIEKEKEIVAVNISNIYSHYNVNLTEGMIKFALNSNLSLKNSNDYFYLATVALLRNTGIKKVAYPIGTGALTDDLKESFDLEKWASLVHKIYDVVSNNHMTYNKALEHYANKLDSSKDEPAKFKEWIKYYKNGEHLKYNVRASGSDKMKKKADFQFPLSGSGFYPMESKPINNKETIGFSDKKSEFEDWKNKLYVAIRRLDKLIRQGDDHLNSQISADLADLLHSFDMEVRKVRMASTATDMTKRAALAFESQGYQEYADALYSLAQQAPVPPEINAAPDDVLGDEDLDQEGIDTATNVEADEENKTIIDALKGSGPKPGEYEALSGDITLSTAAKKLEEIAGRLADRRVIRLLAEFDIMLDKLGVAPMFPELAEAQSKLIDSYSYAITRVTKMLGMLSSGRSISEISSARERELKTNIDKEVDKTFNPEDEGPKGTSAINEEFREKASQPATTPASPEPKKPAVPDSATNMGAEEA